VHLIKGELALVTVPIHFALRIENFNWCLVFPTFELPSSHLDIFRHLIQPTPATFIPVIHKLTDLIKSFIHKISAEEVYCLLGCEVDTITDVRT
jgi:hypothetical protein